MRLWESLLTAPRRVTLRLAIILAVTIGVTLPSAILIPYHMNSIESAARTKAIADHKRLCEILSVILSEPLWQLTPELARVNSQVVYSDPRVAKIEVTSLPDRKNFLTIDSHMQTQKGPFFSLTREIMHGERAIGIVRLTMAEDAMRSGLSADFRRYAVTTFLSLIMAVTFILMVLHWRMVKPIRSLMRESDRLANGNLSAPIALNRDDELGRLALSLEATRLALQRSFYELEVKNQELIEYSGTLKSKVSDRTKELESVNKTLQTTLANVNSAQEELARVERMAALGSMVAGVAHELNTPLGNCLLVASTLEDETKVLVRHLEQNTMRRSDLIRYTTTASESTKLLLRGLKHSARLVGDFKQVAVDQSSVQRRKFPLAVMLNELTALLQSGIRKTPYTLELYIGDDIIMDSYPGPLGQVFTNLVNNSITHGFDGAPEGTIRCSAYASGEDVLIDFEDNGKGIPPDIIKRIFEPFFTTKFGQGGSGLGLSITFNIVTNVLGGEISVDSNATHGTRFQMRLPRVAPLQQVPTAEIT
jgi:two-component system, NtrC family, sensor kinase